LKMSRYPASLQWPAVTASRSRAMIAGRSANWAWRIMCLAARLDFEIVAPTRVWTNRSLARKSSQRHAVCLSSTKFPHRCEASASLRCSFAHRTVLRDCMPILPGGKDYEFFFIIPYALSAALLFIDAGRGAANYANYANASSALSH